MPEPAEPMQNWAGCSSLAVGDTVTLADTRDNEEYLVGKLADNKCWMLDNLRLDITNSTILDGLSTSNTHVDSASLISLRNGNRSAGDQYASAGFSSAWSGTLNAARASADYKDITTTSYGSGSGKIGVYYNFCAASAGSYCYDINEPSSDPDTASLQDAKYDLCPIGWRIPTSDYGGDYRALYAAYSSNNIDFKNALSTPYSGYIYGSTQPSHQGSNGYFWSSTQYYEPEYMFSLRIDEKYVDPSEDDARYRGISIRCLLAP